MIPGGWTRVKVADVCTLQNGNGFRPDDWTDHGYPIIRIQNLNGNANFNYFAGIPDKRWLVENGQMLFAWAGTKGASFGPTIWRGPTGVLNQHIFKVFPRKNAHHAWLFLALRYVTDRIEVKAHGFKSTLVHVKKSDIEENQLLLPPLPEQRRITAVIDAWDQSIAFCEKLVKSKEQRLEWVRSNVLGGVVRLSGFTKPWQTVPLARVLTEHGHTSTGNEEVHSVSVHQGLVNQIEHLGRSFAAANTDHYNRVLPGDIVYTKSPTGNFPLGIIKQSRLDKAAIVSPLYGVFTPASRELGTIMDTLFASPAAAERLLAPVVQKGAKNTIAVTNKNFLKAQLHLPTDQREIVALSELVEAARAELDVHRAELKLLRNQKRGLMQKLLTGQWRVPESIDALLPAAVAP